LIGRRLLALGKSCDWKEGETGGRRERGKGTEDFQRIFPNAFR
jgi:hypothetical protein